MIVPKKKLGQHFLRDENVARKIVQSAALGADDLVLEIGPGTGALTKHLIQASKHVIGIEIDARAAALLRESFGERMEVVEADLLEVDLHALAARARKPLRVVGNIPYYITSEILFRLFEFRTDIKDATLMMQLEVAQRLIAKPRSKSYGILSVSTQLYTKPEILFKVSRNSFFPKPEVDSAVVHCTMNQSLPRVDLQLFSNVVRATFGKRRKTLRNGLRFLGCSDSQLTELRIDLTQRPEELSVDDFLQLTRQLEPYRESLNLQFS